MGEWTKSLRSSQPRLSPHPNVVKMFVSFADFIPDIKDSMLMFPDALPRR